MVPIGPGLSEVVLRFSPPSWLAAWYWLCLLGWIAVALLGLARLVKSALAVGSPPYGGPDAGLPPTAAGRSLDRLHA